MSQHEPPDRSHLVGKEVRIKLHRWAPKGPKKGIFLGQGDKGIAITTPGGGRHLYQHSHVKSISPVD